MKSSSVETLIGAAVIAIAAAFFLFAYKTSGQEGVTGGYRILAEFDNAEGINVGSDVRMAGVKIGTVVEQSLNPENFQAHVAMQIDPVVKLTEDVTAKVTAEGLLGSKFISLEQGGADTRLADGGMVTYTQGAVDIWSLISQAMFDKTGKSGGSGGNGTPAPEPAPPPDTANP
jgi:phospholipid/cholesterol/gamma-HCH transport system substrate-binding protein